MSTAVVKDDIWKQFVETRQRKLRDELINEYAPLVHYVVGRLGVPPTSLVEPDDLVSYGTIGLIGAVDRFDPTRGVRFETYAMPRIRGAVIDHLRTLNWLSRASASRVRQMEAALVSLEQRLGRPAKEEEVASELGVSIERYRQMLLDASTTILSLDVTLNVRRDDDMSTLKEMLEDDNALDPAQEAERHELVGELSNAIRQLPEREQLLLALYYQEELTMKEISKVMSISESRVCQLHMQAILRLRGLLHAQKSEESQRIPRKQTAKSTRAHKTSKHDFSDTQQVEETTEMQNVEAVVGGKHKRLIS
jgi:RNA polymerase sigma factor FliA